MAPPTREQADAPVFDHQLILASAGSGKTYQISGRFLALLAAGEQPDHVFASTFTRKAAGEILDRIMVRLANAACDDAAAQDLAAQLQTLLPGAALDRETCRATLRSVIDHLHRLNVRTLDSFFIAAARCFSAELGLRPTFTIADEVADAQLRHHALDALLGEYNDADGAGGREPFERLVETIGLLDRGSPARSVYDRLLETLSEVHRDYLENPDPAAWCWPVPAELGAPLGEAAEAAAIDALDDCAALLPLTKAGEPNKTYVTAFEKVKQAAGARDWEAFLTLPLVASAATPGGTYGRGEVPQALRDGLTPLTKHARAVVAAALAAQSAAAHRLIESFDRHLRRLRTEQGLYRFDDITRCLAAVASPVPDSHAAQPRLTAQELAYRLDARLHHVLIDEFQDTSIDQWRALTPVTAELLSQTGDNRAALIVADPKQAIYGWRGGCAELTASLRDSLELKVTTLAESWRSSPIVLDAVNRVFGTIASNAAFTDDAHRAVAALWAETFTEHEAARPELRGHVRLTVAPAPPDSSGRSRSAKGQAVLRHAADVTANLADRHPGRSIGVLTRTNRAVATIIFHLRRAGVAASEEGGNPLTDTAPVLAILSLLRLADHPADTIARYHVATTPLGGAVGYTDHTDARAATALSHEVRRMLLTDGYGPTLMRWVSRIAERCDRREVNRLMQLVELGHQHDADASLRTASFIARVQTARADDPRPTPIRVMTVHQAKGLEFDIVVLPELDTSMLPANRAGRFIAFRPSPLERPSHFFPYIKNDLRPHLPQFLPAIEQEDQRTLRDNLSLLYVALTRARHALHMIVAPEGSTPPKNPTPAIVLRNALAPDAAATPETVLLESGDADWSGEATPAPVAAADADSKHETPRLTLAKVTGRSRHLLRRSPSSLEGGTKLDLAIKLRLDLAPALSRGTAIHALFEKVAFIDEEEPDDESLHEAIASIVGPDDADEMIRTFRRMLAHPETRGALSRASYRDRHHLDLRREQRFAVRTDDDTLLTGAFDRLVLMRAGGEPGGAVTGADLIDFKTDAIDPGDHETLNTRIEYYTPQIRAYRAAIRRMYGLPDDAIRTRLLFVGLPVVHEVGA